MTSKASPISLGNSALGICEDRSEAVEGEACNMLGMGACAPREAPAAAVEPDVTAFLSISFSIDSR